MIRDKKTLGKILLDNKKYFKTGLCNWLNRFECEDNLITWDEKNYIKNILRDNPPKILFNNIFYWKPCYIKPRINWIITNLIETNKTKNHE